MDIVEKIKSKVLPSFVISKFVKLNKKGAGQFSGLCPFHSEKTPSFGVNDNKGFYHCFGCGAHGDVISFLQNHKGVDFQTAIKDIASEYGIEIQPVRDNIREKTKMQNLLDVLERVCLFFQKSLEKNQNAQDYLLKKRKVSRDAINYFRIGFCPESDNAICEAFEKDLESLLELGVLVRGLYGKVFSRFRDRIIIPILDKQGRVIGFGGRVLQNVDGVAKYLNSSDSILFKKNEILFNYKNVSKEMKNKSDLIICEGYMDVISFFDAGIKTAMACMGTAISSVHVRAILGLSSSPVFALDSDEAGRKAEKRIIEILLPEIKDAKQEVFFIDFKPFNFKDADEYFKSGGSVVNLLNSKISLPERIWQLESFGVNVKNPKSLALLEESIAKYFKLFKNEHLKKSFEYYFKSQIFELKYSKKKNVILKNNLPLPQKILPDEVYLIVKLFLERNLWFCETETFLEYAIDVESVLYDLSDYDKYVKTYDIDDKDAVLFYLALYKKHILHKLNCEMVECLDRNDFSKAKLLKEELAKVSSLENFYPKDEK